MSRKKTPFFDKKYLSRVALYVAVVLFSVGVLIYLGYHMAGSVRDGIDIMYARSEAIPKVITGDAYIIRDEITLTSTASGGSFAPVVRDGGKVSIGSKVVEVYGSAPDTVLEKIRLIDDQIEFYEKCIDTHLSVGDTSGVRRELASEVLQIRRAVEQGDLSGALSEKKTLILDIRRLGVLSGKVTDFGAQIAALNSEKASLKASLGAAIGSVNAPVSGYYFSSVDGYEGVFSSSEIDGVTYSDIIAMIDSASEAQVSGTGEAAGKIVSSFKWYAACRMSAAEAASFSEGVQYDVFLKNNSESVDMTLYKVLTDAKDAVVLFECRVMPEDFDYTRCQQFEAVYEETAGYKIPASALRVHDGFEGVFILDEITVRFRRVDVIGEERGYFLCVTDADEAEDGSAETETDEPDAASEYPYLKENDIIIKSGTGLYVGMTYNPKS